MDLYVVEIVEGDVYQNLSHSLIGPEIHYSSPSNAWVKIFVFKPRKYLDIRRGRKKIEPPALLNSYFNVLRRVTEIDARVQKEEENLWRCDLEEAKAYLSIQLSPEMTIQESVEDVRKIFWKIDEETFLQIDPLPAKKRITRRRKSQHL